MNKKLWLIPAVFIVTPLGAAEGLVIEMYHIDRDGTGAAIGTIAATDGPGGLELRPAVGICHPGPTVSTYTRNRLRARREGRCPAGRHRGRRPLRPHGYWAPRGAERRRASGRSAGPVGRGGRQGQGTIMATRLRLADLAGRALMIHAGGDNFSDRPEKNGGGGARIACGVVPGAS